MKHRRSLLNPLFLPTSISFIFNIITGILIILSINTSYAKNFSFSFTDPLGDHSGIVDVVSMVGIFDSTTGIYEIILTADEENPFIGDFRININLFNSDTGSNAKDSSFFQDTFNDYSLAVASTTITLAGSHTSLLAWEAGDSIALSGPEPLGFPDGSGGFRSAVSDIPLVGYMTDEDTIAYEDFATIKSSDTKPVDVLSSDVVYTQSISNLMPIYGIDLADNFILERGATITGIRFWGGYVEDETTQHDYFTIDFYNDSGVCGPKASPYASFSQLLAIRTPTEYLTYPRNTVYKYEIQLPSPVNIEARKNYYLGIELSNGPGKWGWSGSRKGSFWFKGGPWSNSGLNDSDLAFDLKGSSAVEDSGDFNDSSILLSNAETIFNWAEYHYPEFFPPPCAVTQFLDPWQYRHYPATNVYAGVNKSNEVWVLGDVFGGLIYINTVQEMLDIISSGSTNKSERKQ